MQVFLADLDPEAVTVELFADGRKDKAVVRQAMTRVLGFSGAQGGYVYNAAVPAARPAAEYTARIIPRFDGVAVPLENARVLWQR